MKTNLATLLTSLALTALLTACGSKEKEEKENGSVSMMGAASAMREMANQTEEMQKNGPVETIDFRSLKELLPADADGLPRKEASGEKNGAMGFAISTAEGKYANDDQSETIELTIIDGGGSPMMMGMAAWSMIEVDKESDGGYEKTTKIGDNKAYEKYDNDGKSGEINVLVNKRFVVTAKGRGVSMDKLKDALNDIDLDKLASLK